jgi:hypothetical protein
MLKTFQPISIIDSGTVPIGQVCAADASLFQIDNRSQKRPNCYSALVSSLRPKETHVSLPYVYLRGSDIHLDTVLNGSGFGVEHV